MPKKRSAGKRRKHGEGAVYHRPEREDWAGLLEVGRDPKTGRRVRKLVTGATAEAVTLQLAQLRVGRVQGAVVAVSSEKLGAWLTRWYATFVAPFARANTAAKVRGSILRIQKGPLAGLSVAAVTQERVQVWVNDLAETYSEATVRTTLSTLHQALGKLVTQRQLALNAASGVRIPAKARRADEARAMDDGVRRRFLEQARKSFYYPVLALMLGCGLRSGEACALDVQDFRNPLRIAKTWSSAANAVQGTPKTASSCRQVPMPKALDAILTEHLFRLPKKGPTDPLFQTWKTPHGRLKPTHLDDVVADIAEAIGEPWITPHTLRHTYASTLFRNGVKINAVSKLLGHKDVATTFNLYVHLVPQELDAAAESAGRILLEEPSFAYGA